jgi:hypothetical protein
VDLATASALATAFATVLLSVATFMSVRSANRAARAAERSMLASLRPVLLTSNQDDPELKVGFADQKWFKVPGGAAVAEVGDNAVYFVISLRNVANGLAVLHGWQLHPYREMTSDHATPDQFRRLTRDLYIPAGGVGFWQGAFRDPDEAVYGEVVQAIKDRGHLTIDLLYGDHEGGQRVITRFLLNPRQDGGWYPTTARHWNVDRPDPRS